jgi:dTDP-glucose 4,6-dehydratase
VGIDNLITGDLKNLEHFKGEERFEFVEHDVTTFTSVAGSVSASSLCITSQPY